MAQSPFQAVLKTLFLGLEELAPLAGDQPRVAMLRAAHAPELSDYPHARSWHFEQGFAPYADMLTRAGYPVSSEPLDVQDMDRVLFLATRSAEENLATLARGWRMLKPGGQLVAAQHNDLGAKRLDSLMKRLGQASSLSKHHCRAVAVTKAASPEVEALVEQWLKEDAPRPVPDTPLRSAPGLFSWRRADAGSKLLIDTLPKSLSGRGADVAAGWGYLSWAALRKCPQISHITLYEAEKRAITLAAENLKEDAARTRFVWCDATQPLDTGGEPFDWVMMNPPAHDMLWSAPEASAAMFAAVAGALKPGGRLWLVANRHLPYERTLESLFSSSVILRENGEFKVMEAVK